MSRRGFQKIIKFLEKLVVRLLAVGLVFLVAVQFILTNSNLEQELVSRIPWTEKVLTFGRKKPPRSVVSKVVSSPKKKKRKEKLELLLMNEKPSPEIKLLVNGKLRKDFSHPQVEVELSPGDEIALDARQSEQGLWFKINSLSTALGPFKTGDQIWVDSEYKVLGQVKVREKF